MRFIYLLLFLFSHSLLAQLRQDQFGPATSKGWQEITISEGLSQGMIYDIKQDHNGFIWAATKDGLNRYDGYNFTVFTHDSHNKYSLSSNACSALLVDRKGRLWVGTLNQGLNLYESRTQRFYHIDMSHPASPDAGNYETVRAFILETAAPSFDASFAAFGKVVEGMDVVKTILASPTSPTKGEGVMKGQMLEPVIKITKASRVKE